MITDWSNITLQALQNAWGVTVEFLPKFVIGLLVFLIGWMIASGIGKVLARVLKRIKFDTLFQKSGWKTALESADIRVNPSEFVGAIVKWVFVIVFLQIFVEILGLAS